MVEAGDHRAEEEHHEREGRAAAGGWANPIMTLLSELVRQVLSLVRLEFALALAEVRATLRHIIFLLVLAMIAMLLGLAGVGALVAAAILRFSISFDPWLAALIVGGSVLLLAVVLLIWGWLSLRRLRLVPERTLRSLRLHRAADREHAN